MKRPEICFDASGFGCSQMMRDTALVREFQEFLYAEVKTVLPTEFMSRLLLNVEVLQGLIGLQEKFDRVDGVFKRGGINDCNDALQEIV